MTYEFASNHYIWGNIAEGFYVPNTIRYVSGINAHDLPPETSITYSAGIRGTLQDQRIAYDIGITAPLPTTWASRCRVLLAARARNVRTALTPTDTYSVAAGKLQFEGVESAFPGVPWTCSRSVRRILTR